MNTATHFPLTKKPPIPPPSKPTTKPSSSTPKTTPPTLPPLSHGLLLSSSSDPLAPMELRLASLPSYPCTAIVSPISQSPSRYPLTHPPNSLTSIPSSPLSSHASPSSFIPRTSLPGLIDQLAGEELVRWREEVWPGGLNAGGCGKEEEYKRPKYIIHTHAPNFANKSYSTPLVKQLLVNCYRGVLVEGMWIAEREEEERRMEEEEWREKVGNGVGGEEGSCGGKGEGRQDEEIDRVSMANEPAKTIMTNGEVPNKSKNTPETPTKSTPSTSTLSSINISSSASNPNLSSPQNSASPIPQIPHTSTTTPGITIAIPALSTGHKSFPHRLAARIAVGTVRDFLLHPIFGPVRRKRIRRVVFCVWPVDSPNRKALQIAFGLMFPPPLPQSAPLSPVSCQLATPPFLPSPRRGRGKSAGAVFDFGGREVDVQVQMVPRIVVTPPVTPVMLVGGSDERERDRDRVISPLFTGERRSIGSQGSGTVGIERVDERDSALREFPQMDIRKANQRPKGNTGIIKQVTEKGKMGRASRGRKDTYRQRKRKQGLRLAAAMRVRRERERDGVGVMERRGVGGGVGGEYEIGGRSATLQVMARDTRTPERMPGVSGKGTRWRKRKKRKADNREDGSGIGNKNTNLTARLQIRTRDTRTSERIPAVAAMVVKNEKRRHGGRKEKRRGK
ncbi:hypothetical protein EAF04_007827 [Stromatinia cepivora]|nr:hypothetical protein EAF04_007827 [Stromatinia cepivora]